MKTLTTNEVIEKQRLNKEASGVILITAFAAILTYPMLPGVASIFLRTSAILIAFHFVAKICAVVNRRYVCQPPFSKFFGLFLYTRCARLFNQFIHKLSIKIWGY